MSRRVSVSVLILAGLLDTAIFAYVASIPNLPRQTVGFVVAWLAAAAINSGVALLIFRSHLPRRISLPVIFGFAAVFRLLLVPTSPTSSDDAFRYVWDGRVQAAGINPYAYTPDAVPLAALRDTEIWPNINRKSSPTIYPPGAQTAFAFIFRTFPNSLEFTKLAFALADLAAGVAIAAILSSQGRNPLLAAVYLWHPLPVVEYAGAGHLDPLFILPLCFALLAEIRLKPGWAGALLAFAALVKFLPAVVLSALWRRKDWRLPVALTTTIVALYVPFLSAGAGVLGFLPAYFGEEEYLSGGRYYFYQLLFSSVPALVWSLFIVVALGAVSFYFFSRSSNEPAVTVGRASTLAFLTMLLVTPSFPWYYGWLVAFAAIDPKPWKLWLTGTVVLAYAWWWLPNSVGSLPGPGHWIYLPSVLLLVLQERRPLLAWLRSVTRLTRVGERAAGRLGSVGDFGETAN